MVTKSVFEIEETEIQYDNHRTEGEKVKLYTETTTIDYPNIILETDELLEHQVTLINNIIAKPNLLQKTDYTVYLKLQGINDLVEMGIISTDRIHILLGKAFRSFTKSIMLSEDEVYEEDLVYAFIQPNV